MRKDRFLNVLFALIVLISFQVQAQEKRLALVIGNSNYEKGYLKNPVNDALLISETLKSLGFDVIIDTNIANIKEFNDAVKEFGERRNQYNVGFIYYAGHAVQIDNVNYLLATTEEYKTDYDVTVNAFSVQTMMRFLTDRSEEVNVLILDACRDNPFEKNWIKTSRSSDGGGGLAKINPPTGSLIAYSTDPGNTAADGDDKNSLYCVSLSKNMLLENTSLDQVFRNVRADVLAETENRQRPVEATQLTGEAFYLKKSSYLDEIKDIDSLIDNEDYTAALVKVTSILALDPNNMQALLRKGRIQYITIGKEYNGDDIEKAIKLYPNAPEVYVYYARYLSKIQKNELALININKAIELDSTFADAYYWRGRINIDEDKLNEVLADYTKAIELDSKNPVRYQYRANFQKDYLQDYNMALLDYTKAIELESENSVNWYNRGSLYTDNLLQNEAAIKDFEQVLKITPDDVDAINALGIIYEGQGEIEKAIKEYEKGIGLETTNPISASYCYSNRANLYQEQNKLDEALADYTKAIELDSKNPVRYENRAIFYTVYLQNYNKALIDYSKALELQPENSGNWYNRGVLYTDNLIQNEAAFKDFEQVLKIAPDNIDAINYIGLIYEDKGKIELALKEYEKGIALEKSNPISAAYCYSNRAILYEKQNKLNEALADYSKAIELDSKNSGRYTNRANFYTEFLQNYNKALIDYSKALELQPENSDNWYNRGVLYTDKLLQNDSAFKDFERVLKIAPDNIDAINYIGIIYEDQGKIDEAIKEYEKGIALEISNPISAAFCYNNRANLYQEQNKLNEALADYSKAIELDSKNSARYLSRANFYTDYLQDYSKAIIDYSKAIDLEPENSDNWYNRGLLYTQNLLHNEAAIKDFEQVLKIAPDDIDAINAIGLIYEDQGKIDEAIKEYEKGIALEISDPISAAFCYNNRANLYQEQNKLNEALSDYTKAIDLDSKNSGRYTNRANFYKDYLQDYSKALLDYTKAIELEPENSDIWYNRGSLYTDNLVQNELAIKDFEQVLKIAPDDIDAINAIGLIYEDQGKIEKAIEEYEKGIALELSNSISVAFCYSNRAILYEKQNKLIDALADYTKAIELDSKNPARYQYRAIFYVDYLKDYNKALLDYTKAIELEPENIDIWYSRGLLYKENFLENESAIKDFEQVLKIAPDDIGAINAIGLIYEEQGEIKLAIKEYEKGIALENTSPESAAYCYSNRANLYQGQNKLDEALADYTKAIELDLKNPERYQSRAYFFIDYLQDYNKALIDYTKAIELDPLNSDIWYSRGILYYENLLQNELAIKDFEQVLKIAPDDIDAINYIGLIYEDQGKIDKAIKEYEKGIALEKNNPLSAAYCYSNRANLYREQGKIIEAQADYSKAIELDSKNPIFFCNRGQFNRDYHGKHYDALIDFSRALELDSQSIYLWSERGLLFSNNLNDHISAIKDFEQIIKIDTNDVVNMNWIGVFYDRLNQSKQANHYYQKTIKKVNDKFDDSAYVFRHGIAWAYSNLAETFQIEVNFDSAHVYYSKAIELDAENAVRYYYRACFLGYYLGKYDESIKDLDQAIILEPKNPEWLLNRAKIYEKQGKNKEALDDYTTAIKLSDNSANMLAERGRFYVQIKEFKNAGKDLQHALKADSNLNIIYHYKILMLKEQNLLEQAIELGKLAIDKFENDTISNYYLGDLYQIQKEYQKALKYYTNAVSIMEFDKTYKTIEPTIDELFLSDVHNKIGEIYKIYNEKELMCESFQNALNAIEDEMRPDKTEVKKLLNEKIQSNCAE